MQNILQGMIEREDIMTLQKGKQMLDICDLLAELSEKFSLLMKDEVEVKKANTSNVTKSAEAFWR